MSFSLNLARSLVNLVKSVAYWFIAGSRICVFVQGIKKDFVFSNYDVHLG